MARIAIEVTEKGINQTDAKLKKLGKTGKKTEQQTQSIGKGFEKMGKSANDSIALIDGPLGGLASRVTSLTALVGGGAAGLVGAFAAGAAAAYAMANAIGTTVREMDNMARVSGLTLSQYKSLTFAATQYGLTVDQLGDAFKDTRERIGDFISTGGGPLQDFGDVMGYTKEQTLAFAKSVEGLSGQAVLVKMVSELEGAGKSTEQMSFALEGMANDMTKLLPLLSSGGKALSELQREADMVTNPLSEDDVKLYKDFKKSVDLVGVSFSSFVENNVTPLLAGFTALNKEVATFFASMNEGSEAQLNEELAELIERERELNEALARTETGLGRITNVTLGESSAPAHLNAELERVNASIDNVTDKLRTIANVTGQSSSIDQPVLPSSPSGKTKVDLDADTVAQKNIDALLREQEAIRMFYLEGEELANASFQKEIERIRAADFAKEEQMALEVEAVRQHTDTISQIRNEATESELEKAKAAAKEQERIEQQKADAQIGILTTATSLAGSLLDRQSSEYKVIASTEALVSAYLAANKTLAAYPGVPGQIQAGLTLGMGLANVAAINSARFQGGQVDAGSTYGINERGDEIFTPKVAGRVFSRNDMQSMMNGGGNSQAMIVNVYNESGANVTAVQEDDGSASIYVTKQELPELMAFESQNPDSQFNQAYGSVYQQERR